MTRDRASQQLLRVRLLEDGAGLWSRAMAVLGEPALGEPVLPEPDSSPIAGAESGSSIGIATWKSASRSELAELPSLRERHAGPVVVILGGLPSVRGARVLAARVEGSVLVKDLAAALLPTLQAVAAGQCVVPGAVRGLLERPPLSPRERQVLAMVVLDFSNAEIARKLVVTESNVKSHLTSAFTKLGVSSRSAAAELILDDESGLGPGILRISPDE